MEIRFQSSAKEVKGMSTDELRANFLISSLMKPNEISLVYAHFDRIIVGGVNPLEQKIFLPNEPELKTEYFLQRREIGIINTGGDGMVEADVV